ncbi:hypothetical protein HK405_000808, partial [Cladochytrium tenue]
MASYIATPARLVFVVATLVALLMLAGVSLTNPVVCTLNMRKANAGNRDTGPQDCTLTHFKMDGKGVVTDHIIELGVVAKYIRDIGLACNDLNHMNALQAIIVALNSKNNLVFVDKGIEETKATYMQTYFSCQTPGTRIELPVGGVSQKGPAVNSYLEQTYAHTTVVAKTIDRSLKAAGLDPNFSDLWDALVQTH